MAELVSTITAAVSSAWARGSLFLSALAAVVIALTLTLLLCAYLQIDKAAGFWTDYGLVLILSCVGLPVLAFFKWLSERKPPNLSLIANMQQSFWAHSTQSDGSVITQLSLRFQATNLGDTTIQLSDIKLSWPWVRSNSIITKTLMTRHPTDNVHSSKFPVMPHALTEASATIVIRGTVGGTGRKRAMRVSVSIQDHARRWHKLVFPHLRNPAA